MSHATSHTASWPWRAFIWRSITLQVTRFLALTGGIINLSLRKSFTSIGCGPTMASSLTRREKQHAHKNDPSFRFDAESIWTVFKRQHSAQIRACRFTGSQAHP
jgi:hypothetical protein